MKAETFLTTHRLFTREEFAESLRPRGVAAATVDSPLARWRRQGRIAVVKRGLFVCNKTPDVANGPPPDYLALASRMAPDAALAYHTALEAHGLAQSAFERMTFVTWTHTRPLEFQGRRFIPVRPPAALRTECLGERWIDRLDRAGTEVRVTSVERTVADVLDRLDLSGGPHEVWRSLQSVAALDPVAIEAYVTAVGIGTLAAKVGWFLESRQQSLVIPDQTLERLAARTPRSPVFLDRRALRGRLVARWSLIVPEDLRPTADEERA
jgi:predicted transcriptional regulator of viral defense system